ncbi:hypothetical protein LEP1GSC016_0502 [Leptospira borgpetersenii serovar Hardjo-bovis str. Sponselee]|uniref:Uncharacterized protein n=1 Tax=Leptospira borgpetersenii serovar Hardjo-bovis str. Sponselee TaxID=1303729 RepID=M6BWM9_LEPBO|nr:hypothetical protein LEP1GSC016_0502 [Leptospira borgpetersenii serovar Hardjo-bovis str. Sponselee]
MQDKKRDSDNGVNQIKLSQKGKFLQFHEESLEFLPSWNF